MMTADFDRLFDPRSIAVVGGSVHPEKAGHVILENLKHSEARVYVVNPYEEVVEGHRAYRDVGDLPETVDMAVIAVAARTAVPVVRSCAEAGVGFAIVIAGGFSEMEDGGEALEEELREAVAGTDTRVLGPNTLGVLAPWNGLDTFFIPEKRSPRPKEGNIALISQSGSIMMGVTELAEDTGVGMRCCVGIGNRVNIDENDLLEYLGEDEGTGCVAVYLESFADGDRLFDLCRRVSPHRPVTVLKAGRTEVGKRAASSHTGSLASGSDALARGVLSQAGAIVVNDEQELMNAAKALAKVGHIEGDRVAIISSTGGFGVIAADLIESKEEGVGMRMAELGEGTCRRLRENVLPFASVRNPIDLTGAATDEMYREALAILKEDEGVDVILVIVQLQPPGLSMEMVRIVEASAREGGVPMLVCSIGGRLQRPMLRRMEGKGMPTYPTLRKAVWALRALYDRGRYLRRLGAEGQ